MHRADNDPGGWVAIVVQVLLCAVIADFPPSRAMEDAQAKTLVRFGYFAESQPFQLGLANRYFDQLGCDSRALAHDFIRWPCPGVYVACTHCIQ